MVLQCGMPSTTLLRPATDALERALETQDEESPASSLATKTRGFETTSLFLSLLDDEPFPFPAIVLPSAPHNEEAITLYQALQAGGTFPTIAWPGKAMSSNNDTCDSASKSKSFLKKFKRPSKHRMRRSLPSCHELAALSDHSSSIPNLNIFDYKV